MSLFRTMYTPSDFDAAHDFWSGVCDLGVVTSWDDETGRGAIFQAPGAQIEIFGTRAPEPGPRADHPHQPARLTGALGAGVAWEVADVDATFDTMAARGVTVLAEPTDRPWGMRMATVAGPDDVIVSVFAWQ